MRVSPHDLNCERPYGILAPILHSPCPAEALLLGGRFPAHSTCVCLPAVIRSGQSVRKSLQIQNADSQINRHGGYGIVLNCIYVSVYWSVPGSHVGGMLWFCKEAREVSVCVWSEWRLAAPLCCKAQETKGLVRMELSGVQNTRLGLTWSKKRHRPAQATHACFMHHMILVVTWH